VEYVFIIICLFAAGFFALYFLLRRLVYRLFAKAAQLDTIKDEVEKTLVELNAATSRNIDLIEERLERLRETLATVDKRLVIFRREIEKNDLGKKIYSSIIKKPLLPAEAPRDTEIVTTISLRDKVLNLYHAGFTTAMIANQLNSSVGEIELIISLAEKE
jgi:hypothetical protein